MALTWSDGGVVGAQLPEADAQKTLATIARRFPNAVQRAPHCEIQIVIDAIVALISGEARDLSFVELDVGAASLFNLSVYTIARSIQPGCTRTYGDIALQLGDRHASRAIGRALSENPWPIIVPCHRVLAAGGKIGGFSANGGVTTKARLLAIEKARTCEEPSLFGDAPTFSLAPRRC